MRKEKQENDPSLKQRTLSHLSTRVAEILRIWRLLVNSGWDFEVHKTLLKHLHALTQLTNKHSLSHIYRVTSSLSQLLESAVSNAEGSAPSQETIRELDVLFKAFNMTALENHEQRANFKPTAIDQPIIDSNEAVSAKRWLYLLGIDNRKIKGLLPLLEELDISCQHFETCDELSVAMKSEPAVAIVCHVDLLDLYLSGQERLVRAASTPATIVIAETDDLKMRLHAMRAGVDLYLSEPLDVAQLSIKIYQLIYPKEQATKRVLVVEDDAFQADYSAIILKKSGYITEVITDPYKVMPSIEVFQPDLILMDLYMPEVSGTELATIIREHSQCADIPIIFLSGEQNIDLQLEALSVGGEDFITKPVVPKQLVSIVRNRIKRAEERHQRQGETERRDNATGLFSRDYLLERLEIVLKLDKTLHHLMGLIYFEIDMPDLLMERIGIAGVDTVLAEIGKRLTDQTTESDLSAHFGDYSFVVLTTKHRTDELMAMAEGIRQTMIDEQFFFETQSIPLTVSTGVLPLQKSDKESLVVLSKVRQTAKAACSEGGNRVQLYSVREKIDDDIDKRICQLINNAVDKNLFEVYYQPMVSLHARRGEFYQTLIRLQTSDQKVISASQFIDTAKQNGLIDEIDRWIVEHTIHLLSKRLEQGFATHFFVCQSASSFYDETRAGWLKLLVNKHHIGFNHLTFEFKLSDIKANFPEAKAYIESLKEMNISSLISEFTADDESYQIIKNLPVNFVKVDRCYMGQLKDRQRAIFKKLHHEKIFVIAPCVEDTNSIVELWQSGADFVQGYFIQRPGDSLGYDFDTSVLS
jgi:diguanylate cyclase (GGDEF)-like protein